MFLSEEEIVSAYVHIYDIEAVECSHKKPQKLELFLISETKRTGIYTLYIYIYIYTILKQVPV